MNSRKIRNEKELIEYTKEFFAKYYDDPLTDEDAIEIIQTLRDYSKALLSIARDNKTKPNSSERPYSQK